MVSNPGSTDRPDAGEEASPEALLAWYDRVSRPLPWRSEPPDPYRIVVSEVMLQQTRAETVAARFPRFLERFPDLASLAAAREEEVVAAWSGLGYYRRARNLWRLAREVGERGAWPRTAEALRELPGVGEYTAAAVASIAFGEPVVVVDGNVERVFARRLALDADPKRAAARRQIRAAARRWLSPARPGDGNQALMELGAVVCTPRAPRCGECPLRPGCRAAASGQAERFPRPRRGPRVERVELDVAVVRRRGRWLVFRRDDGASLLAGTWELPWARRAPSDQATAAALGRRYGGRWRLGPVLGTVRHAITKHRVAVRVRTAAIRAAKGEVGEGGEARWVTAAELEGIPVSSLVPKVLAVATREASPTPAGPPGRRRG